MTVATTDSAFVPYDAERVALVISPPALDTIYLGLRQAARDEGGIRMVVTANPLVLNLGDHGAIVQGPIRAISPSGQQALTYWDTSVALPSE